MDGFFFFMYQDSSQELYMKYYCKGIEDFINFVFSNLKTISEDRNRYLYAKFKNKKPYSSNIMIMHLLKI